MKEALIGLAILAVIFVIWMVTKTPAKTTVISQAPSPATVAAAGNTNSALISAFGNAVSSVVTASNAPDDGDDD